MMMGIGTPNSQSKIERPMSDPFVGEDEKELKPMGKVPKLVSGGQAASGPTSINIRTARTWN
jgi:hypothetical protein